ncbi:hypothetical protein CHUAL_012424 [Chamberlinius hualienensis]
MATKRFEVLKMTNLQLELASWSLMGSFGLTYWSLIIDEDILTEDVHTSLVKMQALNPEVTRERYKITASYFAKSLAITAITSYGIRYFGLSSWINHPYVHLGLLGVMGLGWYGENYWNYELRPKRHNFPKKVMKLCSWFVSCVANGALRAAIDDSFENTLIASYSTTLFMIAASWYFLHVGALNHHHTETNRLILSTVVTLFSALSN